ncbi:MAG: CotH kinase family protein [Oscillospiraceae bacterium]
MKRKPVIAALTAAALMSACSVGTDANTSPGDVDPVNPGGTVISGDTAESSSMPVTEENTPPAENTAPGENVLPAVTMSAASGVYPSGFSLTLSSEAEEILYTLDGSDPALSSTAEVYSQPLDIDDRSGDKNVVSAVDTVKIAGSFNEVNSGKDGFNCTIGKPDDKSVDKCTVVRAVPRLADGSFGKECSATYFIGSAEEHIKGLAESCAAAGSPLAVISLAVNYDDLFGDENGIYVKGDIFDKALEEFLAEEKKVRDAETARSLDANYKQKGIEWERTAFLSMLEMQPDGTSEVLNQRCGVRVQGNYSRSDLQKGLRLYARSDYGDKNFRYAVFGEDYLNDSGEVMDKFKTLVLRAGGNCAFLAKFNDAYWQSLCAELNIETKRSRPCVVYLNGEYWGLYILEEDYTGDRQEELHGVNKDDVVIYKGDAEALELGYKLDEGALPDGVTDESYYFAELLDFFRTHPDLRSSEDFAEFEKLVDTGSVMDYFAAEIWMNNKWDWPGKNWSMWRTLTSDGEGYADGRWRFMMYDVEFSGICGEGEASANTIKEDNYKPNGLLDTDTDNPAVLCFAYLMTNDNFRAEFCEKLSGMAEGAFEKTRALERLDHFTDIYSPLYEQFFARYPETGSAENAVNGWYGTPNCIRGFIEKRPSAVGKMVKYCEKTLGG